MGKIVESLSKNLYKFCEEVSWKDECFRGSSGILFISYDLNPV